jgi:tRNA pseudouridine38-40 synthase
MMPQRHLSARMALWLWYRGDRFRGYQRQVQGPTVQECLERALGELGVGATPAPSGRTDLGVHARMQVVSFRAPDGVSPERLQAELPPRLPEGLGLCLARRAHRDFHAQWSCSGKEYRYRLRLAPGGARGEGSSWDVSGHPRLTGKVTPERLSEVLQQARGTRDFIAFHEKSSPRKPRTLERVELVELGDGLFEARLSGSGFGRYQVRYLVGSATLTASGALPEAQWRAALESGETIEGLRAPAEGLVLWDVRYPPRVDPFSAEERNAAPGLPPEPPFVAP